MKLKEINYDLSKPTEVEILNPANNKSFEIPAYISVYSIESKKGKTAQLNIYRDMMANKEDGVELDEDKIRSITSKHLSTLISGWRGIEDDDGKELEYSEANALMILENYEVVFNTVNINTASMGKFMKE